MTSLRKVAWVCAGFAWLGACNDAPSAGTGLMAASSAGVPAAVSGSATSAAAGTSGQRDVAPANAGRSGSSTVGLGSAAQGGQAASGHAGESGGAGHAGVAAIAAGTGGAAGGGGPASNAGGAGSAGLGDAGAAAGAGGAGLGVAGSAGTAGQQAFQACPSDGSVCKIMPFGDSITDGYNPDTPGGYRIELFRLAHAAGKNLTFVGSGSNGPAMVDGVAFPQQHEGHSGWTIAPAGGRSGISTLVDSVMPQYAPDIVLLMIGTNDAIDNYQMAEAPARLGALIDAVYAQLPEVVIVVAQLIPGRGDVGQGDDAALTARVQSYNAAIPSVVKARADAGKHIFSVDMFTPFAREPRSLLQDQWHPNAAGYALIGREWYAALQPLL